MRVQLLLVVAIAITAMMVGSVQAQAASPPPPPFACTGSGATNVSAIITNAINNALLPNATNTKTNSTENPYWSFTTPSPCWSSIYGIIPSGCYGGKTYSGKTGVSTTITGAFDMTSNVSLKQTYCNVSKSYSSGGGTWKMTATWPQISANALVAIYPVAGNDIGVSIVVTTNNVVATAWGTYSWSVNTTVNGTYYCLNSLTTTNATSTVSSVSSTVAGNSVQKISNKVESQIEAAATNITTNLNNAFQKTVGKCKVRYPPPRPPPRPPGPRPPLPPKSPSKSPSNTGRRLSGSDEQEEHPPALSHSIHELPDFT